MHVEDKPIHTFTLGLNGFLELFPWEFLWPKFCNYGNLPYHSKKCIRLKKSSDQESFHQHRFSLEEFHTLPFSILNLRHAEVVSFRFCRKTNKFLSRNVVNHFKTATNFSCKELQRSLRHIFKEIS